jgi:CheY-specific phosphatase CheX
MAVKFFGQFLIENSLVSRDALLKAIDLQEEKNLKFGEMALRLGYVTPLEIGRAHAAQLTNDMKLGDLLVEMGILTAAQRNDVITRQKNAHLYIGEALVLVGALSSEKLQQFLDAFKIDQDRYDSGRVKLPDGIADSPIWEMAIYLTCTMITRLLDRPFRRATCRTISSVDSNFMLAAMDLSGDVEACFILSVSENLQKTAARVILREKSVENIPVEVLEDTVMELANVVCGNIAAKASQMGKIIHINPPRTIHPPAAGLAVPSGYRGLCFPIHLGEDDTMELILFIKN